jgi:hypothetical protein
MALTYEIDAEGVALIFFEGSDKPSIIQPCWPDNTSFAEGEAQAWAEQYVLFATDPTAEMPGDNPANPTKPRPVAPTE